MVLYRVRHQMVCFTLIRKPFLQGVNKRIVWSANKEPILPLMLLEFTSIPIASPMSLVLHLDFSTGMSVSLYMIKWLRSMDCFTVTAFPACLEQSAVIVGFYNPGLDGSTSLCKVHISTPANGALYAWYIKCNTLLLAQL